MRIDFYWCCRESAVEIAKLGVIARLLACERRTGRDLCQVVSAVPLIVCRSDHGRCGTRLFERFGYHHGNGLMVMRNVATPE